MNKPLIIVLLGFAALLTAPIVAFTSFLQVVQAPRSTVEGLQQQAEEDRPRVETYGKQLPLEFQCLRGEEEELEEGTQVTVLPSNETLVGVCDLLLMLDAKGDVVWQYTVPQTLCDFAYVQSTGLIYLTAGDNCFAILEGSSGKELLREDRQGKAAYGVVKPFGDDMCLVTDSNWGYRFNDYSINDRVTAWRGTEKLWRVDLPPGANLVVNGNRILAITNSKNKLFIKEIPVPKSKA